MAKVLAAHKKNAATAPAPVLAPAKKALAPISLPKPTITKLPAAPPMVTA